MISDILTATTRSRPLSTHSPLKKKPENVSCPCYEDEILWTGEIATLTTYGRCALASKPPDDLQHKRWENSSYLYFHCGHSTDVTMPADEMRRAYLVRGGKFCSSCCCILGVRTCSGGAIGPIEHNTRGWDHQSLIEQTNENKRPLASQSKTYHKLHNLLWWTDAHHPCVKSSYQ